MTWREFQSGDFNSGPLPLPSILLAARPSTKLPPKPTILRLHLKIPRDVGWRTEKPQFGRCVKMRNKLCKPNCKSAPGWLIDCLCRCCVPQMWEGIPGWNWNKSVAWLIDWLIVPPNLPALFSSSFSSSVSFSLHLSSETTGCKICCHSSQIQVNKSAGGRQFKSIWFDIDSSLCNISHLINVKLQNIEQNILQALVMLSYEYEYKCWK